MRHFAGALLCVLLWTLSAGAAAAWVRSRGAEDELVWKWLRPDGQLLHESGAAVRSSKGGVRVAVRWGTHLDHGATLNLEYHGTPGFSRAARPAAAYPAAAEPSAHAERAGFGVENGEYPWRWPGALRTRWVGVTLPYWAVAMACGAIPLLWLRRARRRARAQGKGRCAACGYDMRATPDRCPECGATPAGAPRAARLPPVPRAVAASMLAVPVAVAWGLHARGFFEAPPAAGKGPLTAMPWVSPTVWAAKKLTPPAGFAAYTDTIAGTTTTFTMVPIPGGRFRMGSPAEEAGRRDDEDPDVEVVLEPFYMGRCEVTQAEYNAFLSTYTQLGTLSVPQLPQPRWADAVTYPTPLYELAAGPILQRMGRGGQFPAVIMSHYAACQYTKWLSRKTGRFYRLATEAEWEYACRAGTTTAYHFGDDAAALPDHGWFYDNSTLADGDPGYRPVAQKKPNPWGLYDMHGNVAEWVIDGYARDHYAGLAAAAGPGGAAVAGPAAVNWPAKRYPRVVRGGGYESEAADCRSAARHSSSSRFNLYDPDYPKSVHYEVNAFWVGFRVVSPLREPSDAEKQKYWAGDDPQTIRALRQRHDRQIREIVPPY